MYGMSMYWTVMLSANYIIKILSEPRFVHVFSIFFLNTICLDTNYIDIIYCELNAKFTLWRLCGEKSEEETREIQKLAPNNMIIA